MVVPSCTLAGMARLRAESSSSTVTMAVAVAVFGATAVTVTGCAAGSTTASFTTENEKLATVWPAGIVTAMGIISCPAGATVRETVRAFVVAPTRETVPV